MSEPMCLCGHAEGAHRNGPCAAWYRDVLGPINCKCQSFKTPPNAGPTLGPNPALDGLLLHSDAQVAAIVWAKLLPNSYVGTIPCPAYREAGVSRRTLNRSLAVITSARDLLALRR